ncbi:sensor histidine kinase, partial [Tenacibaculum sp. SG-28]|uniref:sensor histidine kinase n=1 Tax=Tenacibaculum sp. SG-28 TaxID=754426 RepID=UPI000D4B4D76
AANSLQVEVIEYGVSNALEISFEITIFRIVQELVTNIIKHAAATKATINLSQFDKNLSIIIEDNGIGFDQTTITTEKGIGMASIQKRITHLEGTFTLDSTVGKGTSILIDIPL